MVAVNSVLIRARFSRAYLTHASSRHDICQMIFIICMIFSLVTVLVLHGYIRVRFIRAYLTHAQTPHMIFVILFTPAQFFPHKIATKFNLRPEHFFHIKLHKIATKQHKSPQCEL